MGSTCVVARITTDPLDAMWARRNQGDVFTPDAIETLSHKWAR